MMVTCNFVRMSVASLTHSSLRVQYTMMESHSENRSPFSSRSSASSRNSSWDINLDIL